MTYRLVISDHARDQLEGACSWWAENRSAEQAERWYDGFSAALLSLCENPERYTLAAESSVFPFDVRQLNYGLGRKPNASGLVYHSRPHGIRFLHQAFGTKTGDA